MNPSAASPQDSEPPSRRWRLGPGLLVTAAFIGPGTVATASMAGAKFGFALLWTLLFAVLATIALQEMAARLGLVARMGLAEALRSSITSVWGRRTALALVLSAIVLGNTAYQTGNLMGAGMGLSVLTGLPVWAGAVVIGLTVAVALAVDSSSRWLPLLLIAIVIVMSLAFVATAVMVRPDMAEVTRGMATLAIPAGGITTALALVGTTVVPYNLFLHAALAKKQLVDAGDAGSRLRASRIDTVLAILLGGLVTMAIVATSAAAFHTVGRTPSNTAELALQLEPLLGAWGTWLFAAGLAAAGLTSAVTAPMAAGYVVAEVFPAAPPRTAKLVAIAVVLVGSVLAAALGRSPQATIVAAQAANGLLLPLIACFLLLVVNRRDLLGEYRNGWMLNVVGAIVVLVACILGGKNFVALW